MMVTDEDRDQFHGTGSQTAGNLKQRPDPPDWLVILPRASSSAATMAWGFIK